MDVQLEETGRFGRKLQITVPAPDVDKAFDQAFKKVAKAAKIPGFRPGKAPREVLEKTYQSEIVGEVREQLITESLSRAMDDKKLSPVGAPQLTKLGNISRGKEFSYTAECEVQPEITLTQTKGLKVEKVVAKVEAKAIDEQLDQMQKQAAQLVPVMLRDTVEENDVVLIDYEGTMGGIPFKGGKAENALIEITSEAGYLPQLVDGLRGARVPGERSIQVDFPADYQAKDLAGKPATFRVQLKELKKKELPALDDEFAKDLGEETLDALKGKIELGLKQRLEREAESEQRKKLLQELVAKNPFEVPPSMINEHADRMIMGAHARVEQMMRQRVPLSQEDVVKLRADSMADAELQVRSGLLLLKVAEEAGLKVDNTELSAEIEAMIQTAGEHGPRVRAAYQEADSRSRLAYRLLEEKTVKYLLEHAEITEPKPSATQETP